MGRQIENNIYSAIKMRKGHRRTQSDIVHVAEKNTSQPLQQPKQSISHLQITKLLNICNQKAKQKVSNVEVLSPPTQNSYIFFQFGQNSLKKSILVTQNDYSGDYLACIPERKQSIHQECEQLTPYFLKRTEFRDRKGELAFEQKFRRQPFSDALNNKPRERRKAQPEKNRQEKKEIRSYLGLKLKF